MANPATPDTVIEHLERARGTAACGIALDADGTLWSGDVGEDVYEHACRHRSFRPEAEEALRAAARAHSVASGTDDPIESVAAALYAAYERGAVDHVAICEVMTWGYAGFTEAELGALARAALEARGLGSRVHQALLPILDWARRTAVRTVVVSASPRVIVAEALAVAGLSVDEVVGSRAGLEAGRMAPRMAEPLPFAEQKVTAGMRALAGADWLGSFGDNFFDFDMLRAARVAVAVCPKPGLLRRLDELPNALVLE